MSKQIKTDVPVNPTETPKAQLADKIKAMTNGSVIQK